MIHFFHPRLGQTCRCLCLQLSEDEGAGICLRADCKDDALSRHHHVVGSSALRPPRKNPPPNAYIFERNPGGGILPQASMEEHSIMMDNPVELDERRGMAAQKLTEIRRRLHEVQADQAALRRRQEEFREPCPRCSVHDLGRGCSRGAISDPAFR